MGNCQAGRRFEAHSSQASSTKTSQIITVLGKEFRNRCVGVDPVAIIDSVPTMLFKQEDGKHYALKCDPKLSWMEITKEQRKSLPTQVAASPELQVSHGLTNAKLSRERKWLKGSCAGASVQIVFIAGPEDLYSIYQRQKEDGRCNFMLAVNLTKDKTRSYRAYGVFNLKADSQKGTAHLTFQDVARSVTLSARNEVVDQSRLLCSPTSKEVIAFDKKTRTWSVGRALNADIISNFTTTGQLILSNNSNITQPIMICNTNGTTFSSTDALKGDQVEHMLELSVNNYVTQSELDINRKGTVFKHASALQWELFDPIKKKSTTLRKQPRLDFENIEVASNWVFGSEKKANA